ncbi:MAG TPA: roadblock/LC7 domain-containing protein [Candidatus Thermoplasmatota archaeon]|nr:roadblock/LC7 domain-containing protein [Candidatus Thermoplasmatota archaeon]
MAIATLQSAVLKSELAATFQATVPGAAGALVLSGGMPVSARLPHGTDADVLARMAMGLRARAVAEAKAVGAGEPASVFVDAPQGRILAVFL